MGRSAASPDTGSAVTCRAAGKAPACSRPAIEPRTAGRRRGAATARRRLRIERLEPRRPLASDACGDGAALALQQLRELWLQELEPLDGDASPAALSSERLETAAGDVEAVSVMVSAADAGSSRRTALDLGAIQSEPLAVVGSIGRWDRRDMFRFESSRDATVQIDLSNLSDDLDLYLLSSQGRALASSRQPAAQSDRITAELDAGAYYVLVTPWGRAASNYQLTIRGEEGPTPTAPPDDSGEEPAPPATPPVATPPVATPPVATPPVATPPAATPPTAVPFPDVAYFGGGNEWNLNAIQAPEVWAQGYTGQGVTVAVVDTGVDLSHPDLVSQLWVNAGEIAGNGVDDDRNGFVDDVQGWDFAGGDNRPDDVQGHGTHVAGTIAADADGRGATGVAPNATIMPVRVLGDNGSGDARDVAAGIRYAADNGADIINLSLGGGYSGAIEAAIRYAQQLGSLVVAAAGNEYARAPGYPAQFSRSLTNVLSVGAHSSSNRIAGFSNDVGASGAVQIDAPGVGVFSSYAGGGAARLSGTSMAAPHVAGIAALALSANPNLNAAQLRAALVAGADRSISGSDAAGGANAATTVALALDAAASAALAASEYTSANAAAGSRFARSARAFVSGVSGGPGGLLAAGDPTTPVASESLVESQRPAAAGGERLSEALVVDREHFVDAVAKPGQLRSRSAAAIAPRRADRLFGLDAIWWETELRSALV